MPELSLWPGNHPQWRYVAVGIPAVDIDPLAGKTGHQNFSVLGIDADRVRRNQSGARPLNHANRRFVSIGAATKYQNGVGQGIGHDNFVVHGVVRQTMNRPPEPGALTRDYSVWPSISICQPGKRRDARLAHSIGHQDLAALGVVSERHRIAEPGRGSPRWRAAHSSFWRDVSVGCATRS